MIELAPAYTSVAVFFDPVDVAKASEQQATYSIGWRRELALLQFQAQRKPRSAPRTVEIQSATIQSSRRLDEVARHAQISTEQVVELHSAADYRVACIGSFPISFMAGLPKK